MHAAQLAKTSREIAALPSEPISFSTMVERIMILLQEAVPCDTINFGTVDLRTELAHHFALGGKFLMPETRRELLPRFKHQNPMVEYARQNGTNPPLRFTDFSSRREFEESPIYRECYKGYTYSMMTFGVEAPKGLSTSFVLSRASGEFSDAEKDDLTLLQPVVSSAIQRQVLQECLLGTHRSATRVGVIHGATRFVHTMDSHACALFRKHFEPASLHELPATFNNLLQRGSDQAVELSSTGTGSRLLTRLGNRKQGWTFHLWEENDTLPSKPLSQFGLTGRQIEVVQWMSLGKTNPEIASILNISYRTVQKHLENIYTLLGVETRVAAINRCREIAR